MAMKEESGGSELLLEVYYSGSCMANVKCVKKKPRMCCLEIAMVLQQLWILTEYLPCVLYTLPGTVGMCKTE